MHKKREFTFLLSIVICPLIRTNDGIPGAGYAELKNDYMRFQGLKIEALFKEKDQKQEQKNDPPKKEDPVLKTFAILSSMNRDGQNSDADVMEENESVLREEIEVMFGNGQNSEHCIANQIDRTQSAAGKVVFRRMLSKLIAASHPKKFAARQALIKKLKNDKPFRQKVEQLLQNWARNEEQMLSNFNEKGDISNEQIEKHYFQKDFLKRFNDSSGVLGVSIHTDDIGFLIGSVIAVGTSIYDTYDRCGSVRRDHQKGQEQKDVQVAMLLGGLLIGTAYQLYNQYNGFKADKDGIKCLQTQMIGVAKAVHLAEKLKNLGIATDEVARGLGSWGRIIDMLHSAKDSEAATLVSLLRSKTFKDKASYFSHSGRVLAAYTLLRKQRHKFAGVVEAMGELDACYSVACLLKEFQDRRVNYCFAQVDESASPYLELKKFWNPLVDPNVVVANDLVLGGKSNARNVVLTGSNTGGKSTVGLKGTLICSYLAHTLGIAPAKSCKLSRFSRLHSHLAVQDNIEAGESLFQAEINRVRYLIEFVNNLKKDELAFIVIDELFTSTSPNAGARGAYKVVKFLAGHPNVMLISATHFKELTKLADGMDSIRNMKIDIYSDKDGNLVKPYKLEDGVSSQNVADILLLKGLGLSGDVA